MLFGRISTMLFFILAINLSEAHQTVLGFEDTLSHVDKIRLNQFMNDHIKHGHNKCYYDSSEDTVICQDAQGIRYYFK